MSDDPARPGAAGDLLTPASRAVAGLALAVAGLLGQNALTTGLQLIFLNGPEAGDQGVFGVLLGFSTAVPAALALFLTWGEARGGGTTWPSHLARATVLVALLVMVGAVLMVVGGFLQF